MRANAHAASRKEAANYPHLNSAQERGIFLTIQIGIIYDLLTRIAV
jgi:hypothetical protein